MYKSDPGRPLSWTWHFSRVRFDVATGRRLVTGAGLGSVITLVFAVNVFCLVFLDFSIAARFSTSVLAAARRHSLSGW